MKDILYYDELPLEIKRVLQTTHLQISKKAYKMFISGLSNKDIIENINIRILRDKKI